MKMTANILICYIERCDEKMKQTRNKNEIHNQKLRKFRSIHAATFIN